MHRALIWSAFATLLFTGMACAQYSAPATTEGRVPPPSEAAGQPAQTVTGHMHKKKLHTSKPAMHKQKTPM